MALKAQSFVYLSHETAVDVMNDGDDGLALIDFNTVIIICSNAAITGHLQL